MKKSTYFAGNSLSIEIQQVSLLLAILRLDVSSLSGVGSIECYFNICGLTKSKEALQEKTKSMTPDHHQTIVKKTHHFKNKLKN